MDLLAVVVPDQGDSTLFLVIPVLSEFIVFPQRCYQVFCVLVAFVFHFKVVDNERERDWVLFVFPKSRRFVALVVLSLV